MALALAAAATLCLILLAWPRLGNERVAFLASLASLTVAPVPLLTLSAPAKEYVVGTAAPEVTVYSYTLVLIAVSIWGLATGRAHQAQLVTLPVAYLLLASVFLWPTSTFVLSGVVSLLLACLAWIVGVTVAPIMSGESTARFTATALAGVAVVLAVPTWIQWLSGAGTDGFGDRTAGVFAHPSTVGKVAVVVIALLLPFTRYRARKVSATALIGVLIGASAAIPSLSRANIIGIALMLALWFAMGLDARRLRQLVLVTIAVAIAAGPFVREFLRRFQVDPDGSDRPELLAAGLRQLHSIWLVGLGPNNYVPTIGPLEPIVASTGFPVHNAFILLLSEIGLLGILTLLPLTIAIARAACPRARGIKSVEHSRALLVMLLALCFIAWTGWGLLRAPMPQLIMMACGALWWQATHFVPEVAPAKSQERRASSLRRAESSIRRERL
ncbi:MAG: hypothetical protein NVV57_03825 [Demequina sp.]|nr:hypothetical protein [Demequina sp.]